MNFLWVVFGKIWMIRFFALLKHMIIKFEFLYDFAVDFLVANYKFLSVQKLSFIYVLTKS